MTLLRRRLVVLNQQPPEVQRISPVTGRQICFQGHQKSVRPAQERGD